MNFGDAPMAFRQRQTAHPCRMTRLVATREKVKNPRNQSKGKRINEGGKR
jgi:hypothetical protein